mgnify:FL=1
MIDLAKEKDRIERIIKSIERSFSFKSVLFNERYLHHYFSHKWLSLYEHENRREISLIKENENLIFHPEWPTYKKATGIDYGRYKFRKEDNPGGSEPGKYMLCAEGSPGLIDFAIGEYHAPKIGIEMTLKYGWSNEEVIYDFVKLLDKSNPFEVVYSLNVILRDKRLPEGGMMKDLQGHIHKAYLEAIERLGEKYAIERERHFIILEITTESRRKWVLSGEKFEVEEPRIEGLFMPGIEDQSRSLYQSSLFKRNREEFIEEVGIDLKTLKMWHQLNLLGFDPEKQEIFDEKEVIEVRFLKGLINSGLSFEKIISMLSKLPRPYCYTFDQIYWDFDQEQWISLDKLMEERVNDYVQENYEELIDGYIEEFLDEKEENEGYKSYNVFDMGGYLIVKKRND